MVEPSLFLDCVFLLVNDNSTRYQKLVNELIGIYQEEARVKEGSDAELIRFYITLINELIVGQIDRRDPDALASVLIKFKTNRAFDKYTDIVDVLKEAFASRSDAEEQETSLKLQGITQRIRAAVVRDRVDKATRKVFAKMASSTTVDPRYQLDSLEDIREELRKTADLIETDDTGSSYNGVQPTGVIRFDDRLTIKGALEKRNARDCKGVIRSGLQGLNRALGEAEGLIPGESICHNALSHHGKSLMIVKWTLWGVEYNPQIETIEGTPLVLLISLENEEYRNMLDIFKMKYIQVEGKSPKGMNDEDIENWIIDYFARFETKFIIERYADGFGFKDYRQRLAFYRALGYRIVLVGLDYLSNMDLGSDDKQASKGSRDNGLRELSYNLVNDARVGGYAFVTGHQLNRVAEDLAEQNTMPVKKFTLKCLQDSSSIYREFDIMAFQYNEVIPSTGIKYLTVNIPKHRHVITPESHKCFAYPYLPDGVGIKDDLGGPPGFVTDPYLVEFSNDDQFNQTPTINEAF